PRCIFPCVIIYPAIAFGFAHDGDYIGGAKVSGLYEFDDAFSVAWASHGDTENANILIPHCLLRTCFLPKDYKPFGSGNGIKKHDACAGGCENCREERRRLDMRGRYHDYVAQAFGCADKLTDDRADNREG